MAKAGSTRARAFTKIYQETEGQHPCTGAIRRRQRYTALSPTMSNLWINSWEGAHVTSDVPLCTACGLCASRSLAGCRTVSGWEYTANELWAEASKNAMFYRKNSGGVDLPSGKVLLQYEVTAKPLLLCRKSRPDTCSDTSGFAPGSTFERFPTDVIQSL